MLGSSVLNPYYKGWSVTGPTGPTGPTGATGPVGNSSVGPIGNYTDSLFQPVSGYQNKIITQFSDGSNLIAQGTAVGTTGSVVILTGVDTTTVSGATVASLVYDEGIQNKLRIKGIKLQNNTVNSKIIFTQTPDSALLSVKTNINTGITTDVGTGKKDLAKIDSDGKYKRALDVFYDDTDVVRSLKFIGSNFVEKTINISKNITGPYSYCKSTVGGTTMDCFINPYFGNNDSDSYGVPPSVLVIDAESKELTISVSSPPSSSQFSGGFCSGFSLYVRNAKNPTPLSSKFKGPVIWPNNSPPCFRVNDSGGNTASCSLFINFYGLNGSWYASTVGITGDGRNYGSYCFNPSLNYAFNSSCSFAGFAPSTTEYNPDPYTHNKQEAGEASINYDTFIAAQPQKNIYVSGTTGACCLIDGSCSITNIENCTGYFHGPGTTCGTNNVICNLPGSCCIQYKSYNKFLYNCVDSLSCTECLGYTGMNSIGVKYNGNYSSCNDTDCGSLFEEMGACCDGVGGCEYTDFSSCVKSGRFFQGIGILCENGICNGGTGSCCTNTNSCGNGIGYNPCISMGGLFLGDGTICADYQCPVKDTCLGYIDGVRIYPGDEYGGGIVVGKFTPGKTPILGVKEYFSPALGSISSGNTFNLQQFSPYRDHSAYYSANTRTCSADDSYVIVMYPYDISVNTQNKIVNPITENGPITDQFVWSHGTTYSAWGPLIDTSGTYIDIQLYENEYKYNTTHLKYSEGYFNGYTGSTYSTNLQFTEALYTYTFPTCSMSSKYGNDTVARVFGKPVYSLNGVWHNSWGLHNTIRIISAENCRYWLFNDIDGNFNYTNFITGKQLTAARSVLLLNNTATSTPQGITGNNSALSDWYLPSHDELGFIGLNCANTSPYITNLNHNLLIKGYQPLSGVYWTSNGAFDHSKSEGIDGITVNPGSLAWCMSIDPDGNVNNFKGYKYSRINTGKVRPIRMLRCDRYYPVSTDYDYYLWKTPKSKIDQ